MDNTPDAQALAQGAQALGIELPRAAIEGLLHLREELLKWSRRVNLTAISDPKEVLEKHFLDSLAILPEVSGARSLLDVGAGAGFPGLPLKLALPALEVTMVEAVGKKVAFIKNALAGLKLTAGGRAVQARAEGNPAAEGLPMVEVVVSRAFRDVEGWVPLASRYLAPGGRVLAMLGQSPGEAALRAAAEGSGLRLLSVRGYRLPWSGAERGIAVYGG